MTADGPQQLTGYRLRDYDDLIARLGESRETHGIDQREVARRLGCHQSQVSEWPTGKVEAKGRTSFAVVDALGYDLALIPREDA